jgi:pilus assembly protein TadC
MIIFIAISAALLVAGIAFAVMSRGTTAQVIYSTRERVVIETSNTDLPPYIEQVLTNALGWGITRRFLTARSATNTQELLVTSGNPWAVTPSQFTGLSVLAGGIGAAIGIVFGLIVGLFVSLLAPTLVLLTPILAIAFTSLGTLFGFYLPYLSLKGDAKKRRKESIRNLHELLDLMSVFTEGGQSITSAIALTASYLPEGVLATEIALVEDDLRANATLDVALSGFYDRVPDQKIRVFCDNLKMMASSGLSSTEVLRREAEENRQTQQAIIDKRGSIGEMVTGLIILGGFLPLITLPIFFPMVFVYIINGSGVGF